MSTTSSYMICIYINCTTLISALPEKRVATFPVLSAGKTDYDYRLAQFVLSQNNVLYSRSYVNIQEVSLYHQAGEHHVPFEC